MTVATRRTRYNYRYQPIDVEKPGDDKTNGLVRRNCITAARLAASVTKVPHVVYRRPQGGPGPWMEHKVFFPNGGAYKMTDTDRTVMECIRVLEALRDFQVEGGRGYSPEHSRGRTEGVDLAIKKLRNHFRLA